MLAQFHSTRANTKNKRTNQRRAPRKVGGWVVGAKGLFLLTPSAERWSAKMKRQFIWMCVSRYSNLTVIHHK